MVASQNRLPSEPPTPTPDAVRIDDQTAAAAEPFVGRWQTLVSTTNWEKGRIIADWRAEQEQSGAAVTQYSDEAWATLVGGVTSQHVGRLRRVHDRFGDAYPSYDGLYWSHFQAALDWPDAEMWLEGAVQNRWSISQMRAKRWEVTGNDSDRPSSDNPSGDGLTAADRTTPGYSEPSSAVGGAYSTATPPDDAPAAGRTAPASGGREELDEIDRGATKSSLGETAPPVRPFADLPELPDDLADAFEQFKLAIITHRLAGWTDASQQDVLATLDSLKVLAQAPTDAQQA